MQVKVVHEKDDGSVEFTATLNPEQTRFLLEFAICQLLEEGVLPFVTEDEAEANPNIIHNTPKEVQ